MNVHDAIKGRASTRAFLNKPVSPEIIKQILAVARWAPSGVNTQPWKVAVIYGETMNIITQKILQARQKGQELHAEYHYYPQEWFEPYKSRRFQCGMALYGAMNIKRDDAAARQHIWELNYHFFGAPVGLIFSINKRLERGSWMDLGMFIQNVMLAARGFQLETCAQASLADYPDIIEY
jgi:nitroreductase